MTPGPGVHRTPLPKGFLASGVNCGVRRYRPDIGLLISETPAVAAGVFTLNECKAAPVRYTQKLLPADNIRAILTNSGQANAATGDEGVEKNLMMVSAAAKALGCDVNQVLVASTGVIGVQLDTEKILPSMPELVARANDTAESFATAILTTDLVPKSVTTVVELSGGPVRITGISKGSGMIHPNMATMLGYILTDVKLEKDHAKDLIKKVADQSFNMISVDGDSSTNDCCFLMANGASGVALKTDEDVKKFEAIVTDIGIFLAKSIAADGEGATKLIEVEIKGSDNLALVRKAARGITLSPLIKTAVHGEDPNWGRILARLGAEGIPGAQLDKMTLHLQGVLLFENGQPVKFVKEEVKVLLKQAQVKVEVDLKSGPFAATAWGCDLSRKYVDINTEYS
ncbi:amino acid acetyltransferase [Bdellovibrio bacteriovorus]|uniref:Arginine biosynthesis bifunctional protein ArgJ n=1 Tax=Bdellovibrio bacteriovorus TaxID=959 RepID=A0A150WJB8_BDEBC|nr:bifunctional glutamate N-acetyltransferase/amino-acid acetyltransferase ArgJ [Bdellovibrio bacteriovorus]KYG63812.1 amino acid acetyltransferase [Bdellovibrio bacteriovorus]